MREGDRETESRKNVFCLEHNMIFRRHRQLFNVDNMMPGERERGTEGYLLVLVWCERKHRIDGKNRKKGNTQSIKIVLHICLYEDNVSMLLYVQMLNFFLLSFFIENFFRCRYPKKFFFRYFLSFTSPPFERSVDSFNFCSLFLLLCGCF